MLKTLARLLVFFATVQVLGGHWLALQSVAWVGMLANYARGETLVIAIEKTFDGKHPCALCKVVESGQETEQKQQVLKVIVKTDAVIEPVPRIPWPQEARWKYSTSLPEMALRNLVPPKPPPESV